MAAEQAPARARQPLFVVLGLAVIALLIYKLWPSAESTAGSSNPARAARGQVQAQGGGMDPAALDVRIGKLEETAPTPAESERNLFRFQPKPPPPPPPAPPAPPPPTTPPVDLRSVFPGRAPEAPPIPLKFIGRLDSPSTGVVAIFSDSAGRQPSGKEGQIILGQYRIVKIGVESVVIEHADGRGRTTLPLRGQ